MNQPGLYPSTLIYAAQGLRIDVVMAEIAQTSEAEGIETVVLEGSMHTERQA